MTFLEQSLAWEKKYGMVSEKIHELTMKRRQAAENARRNGQEFCDVYTPLIIAERQRKNEYRKQADEAFAKHKEAHSEIDEEPAIELLNAMIIRMALDYENALSKKNDRLIYEIEQFAEESRKATYVVERIRKAHKEFRKTSRADIISIIEITDKFRKDHKFNRDFSDKSNPNRCPLCGGGLFIKKKQSDQVFLVGCSSCSLTEAVKLNA